MSPNLKKLRIRLEYRCIGSDDYVTCIREIARMRDPDAIRVLARMLDSSGPIAVAAMDALVRFGEAAVPAMERCTRSYDGEMTRHAEQVLARVARQTARRAAAAAKNAVPTVTAAG
ncbi:MAG TPA: HEAT repeat domain-containing protein [Polyangiaceae bacterium]|jgi:hypothetical protein